MIDQIEKIIEAAEKKGLRWFGLRQHHETVNVGDELGKSHNTIDDQVAEELAGICCLGIDDVEDDLEFILGKIEEGNYQDGPIILVGGTGQEYGNDQFEVIIENAEVLWIK